MMKIDQKVDVEEAEEEILIEEDVMVDVIEEEEEITEIIDVEQIE